MSNHQNFNDVTCYIFLEDHWLLCEQRINFHSLDWCLSGWSTLSITWEVYYNTGPGPHSRDSGFVGVGWRLRVCISNQLPCDAVLLLRAAWLSSVGPGSRANVLFPPLAENREKTHQPHDPLEL